MRVFVRKIIDRLVLHLPWDGEIRFYARDRDRFGFLSNFYPAEFELDNRVWPSSEHFYQAQKSEDPAYREAIRKAKTPVKAKRMGYQREPETKYFRQSLFRNRSISLREDWDDIKTEVMRKAVEAKFAQNPDLKKKLLNTGEAILIEDSPKDSFWGCGENGDGLNRLGQIIMEIRNELRARNSAST